MKKTIVIILLSAIANVQAVTAQVTKSPHKFGNPTNEELTMTTYEGDPEATAVVLSETTDTRYTIINDAFSVVTDVKTCIKILKDEGKDYANVSIVYFNSGKGYQYKEEISNVKATAYNLVGGKVEKTKMNNDLVFREQIDNNHKVVKFTIPKVEVGTVIEYQYQKTSDSDTYIDTWYAQHAIPTAFCRYDLLIPEYFHFNVDLTGHELDKMSQERKASGNNFVLNGQRLDCEGTTYTFTGVNLSALKDDDYIWNLTDVCNKVRAEFTSFVIPGYINKQFTTTWERIDDLLMKDDDFGGRIRRSNPLKKEMTDAGIFGIQDANERILACFKLLNSKYKWNGNYRLWGRAVRDIEKDGGGSNADLNFILINMLRDAQLDAFPMVMSSRQNGTLLLAHPTLNSLNTFIVGIAPNDTTLLFIDTSAPSGALNVVPSSLLTNSARIIGAKSKLPIEWVNLLEASRGRTVSQIQATLANDGTLSGEVTRRYQNNDVLVPRSAFRQVEDSAAAINKMAETMGISISQYSMEGKENNDTQLSETFSFTKQCDTVNDLIYLHLGNLLPLTESPFKADTRSIPVEFSYAKNLNVSVSVTLPEGYVVEELPKPAIVNYEGGDIVFSMKCRAAGPMLSLQVRFDRKRQFFLPAEYGQLKEAYDTIANHTNSTIVIKKAQ